MATIPEPLATKILTYGSLISPEDLYDDGSGEQGLENNPHITIKYGLHTDKVEDVKSVIGSEPAIVAKLGKMSCFLNDNYIVLKLEVSSPDLFRLNSLICKNLEYTDTFPTYVPHCTIAYLRHRPEDPNWYKQLCSDIFDGFEFVCSDLIFSTPLDRKYPIKLGNTSLENRVALSYNLSNKIAAPHLYAECDGELEAVDMYIELYGTGRLPKKYESVLENFYKTTDKREMMRKFMKDRTAPVMCSKGKYELVDKKSGKKIKDIR
jgi:2'-5' RNA ligase